MLRQSLSIVAACLIAGAAQAQSAPSPAPAAPAQQKVKKICRSEVDLGSILPKRKCHTKEEWAAINAANQKDTDNFNNSRSNNRAASGGTNGF